MDDLDKIIAESKTAESQAKTRAYVFRHSGVVYEADPKYPGEIIAVSPNGTRRRGQIINRLFVPLE